MKNILSNLNESEKNRILEMHKLATRKLYLSEQTTTYCSKFTGDKLTSCLLPETSDSDSFKGVLNAAGAVDEYSEMDGSTYEWAIKSFDKSVYYILKLERCFLNDEGVIIVDSEKIKKTKNYIEDNIPGMDFTYSDSYVTLSEFNKLVKMASDVCEKSGNLFTVNLSNRKSLRPPTDILSSFKVVFKPWVYYKKGTKTYLNVFDDWSTGSFNESFKNLYNNRLACDECG